MTTPLLVTTEPHTDGTHRLTVTGEIDMSNAGTLAQALEATGGNLVLDLTAGDYLDSAAIAVLFAHADRIDIIATSLLTPVLIISGLDAVATVRPPDGENPA